MTASTRLKVGVVSGEFFDMTFGRLGGFGWLAREALVKAFSRLCRELRTRNALCSP